MSVLSLYALQDVGVGALLLDALRDAALDSLKILPFLLAAFLLIELLEHHAGDKISRFFRRSGKAGPLAGALLGCIPQCGFSVLSADLYAGGVISLGSLIAVFLSTSDEAIILLAAEGGHFADIARLLLSKVVIALLAGYGVDLLFRKRTRQAEKQKTFCAHSHCGCEEHGGIWRAVLRHTAQVFAFVLLFTFLLTFGMKALGEERISTLFLTDSVWQPLLTALFGFLPNCAASVLLTRLYLGGTVGFGAAVAGLCTSAGAGLLVLFRENRSVRENLKILGILYTVSVLSGFLLQAFGL